MVVLSGGSGVGHPPASSVGVKERVELYLWIFMACSRVTFTFTFTDCLELRNVGTYLCKKKNDWKRCMKKRAKSVEEEGEGLLYGV
jgi:hypothetical protein